MTRPPTVTVLAGAAFTLLEIVLALAILAGALAALGEVLSLARQNARVTQEETVGSLLAASVMAELVAGTRESTEVDHAQLPIETQPPWLHTVEVQATNFDGLLLVRVTVEQDMPEEQRPVSVTLARWVLDPEFVAERASLAENTSDR